MVITVIYKVEMVVFSTVITTFSRKTSAWSISNSYNRIKEEQMLWLDVGFQNFAKDTKEILGCKILKAKEYFPDLSSKDKRVHTLKKIIIVFFGRKIEKILYLMA